jgi:hypothetical protein
MALGSGVPSVLPILTTWLKEADEIHTKMIRLRKRFRLRFMVEKILVNIENENWNEKLLYAASQTGKVTRYAAVSPDSLPRHSGGHTANDI